MCKGIYNMPRNYKLTPEQVLEIKMDDRRPYKLIAQDYGVSIATVWSIINGKKWKHMGENKNGTNN